MTGEGDREGETTLAVGVCTGEEKKSHWTRWRTVEGGAPFPFPPPPPPVLFLKRREGRGEERGKKTWVGVTV